jgi:thymidylate synthase (FAD)
MSGDSKVYFDLPNGIARGTRSLYKLTLKELWEKWNRYDALGQPLKNRIKKMNVRIYDENTKILSHSHIKEVFKTGVKDIFEITLKNGKKIKSTKEHKVLIGDEFVSLEEALGLKLIGRTAVIRNNALIACNGIPLHQSHDWLKMAKEKNIKNKTGVSGIAEDAEVSYHTIREWLKKLNLSFTKKEVGLYPELARDISNITPVHRKCHMEFHGKGMYFKELRKKRKTTKLTVSWSEVETVRYVGKEETYDLEIEGESHNYIADGVIVHNSQRYSEVAENEFYPTRRQDNKNRQNSIDDMDQQDKDWFEEAQVLHWERSMELYRECLDRGIAKEQARFLLPLSTQTTLYMTNNIRNWIHYIDLRSGNGTQQEHKEIALKIKEIFIKEFPSISEAKGWK